MIERNLDVEAKLNALLELSKSTAEGTEHEAKLALEMAIRLASKHGISLTALSAKRKNYAGDWYSGSGATTTIEFTNARYTIHPLRKWCELVEKFGWTRHRRDSDEKEGLIWMYRMPERIPKIEVRIFERPWSDVEFEVVRKPDPILGRLEEYTKMGFDLIELGVTYSDFYEWLEKDRVTPYK